MRFAYRLAGFLTGWIFAHMSFAIPARRLRETDALLAFHHPKPSHPFHVILVPKRTFVLSQTWIRLTHSWRTWSGPSRAWWPNTI